MFLLWGSCVRYCCHVFVCVFVFTCRDALLVLIRVISALCARFACWHCGLLHASPLPCFAMFFYDNFPLSACILCSNLLTISLCLAISCFIFHVGLFCCVVCFACLFRFPVVVCNVVLYSPALVNMFVELAVIRLATCCCF